MFGLGSGSEEREAYVVIDIGSGSAGGAIMVSDVLDDAPEHVWSHREYVLIKDAPDAEVPLKEITTSLVNLFLKLGNDGLRALHAHDEKLRIRSVQVNISAPWTYMVTKHISFSDEKAFLVTERLLNELAETAANDAVEQVVKNDFFTSNGLELIDTNIIGVITNGYLMEDPVNINTKEIEVAYSIGIAAKRLIEVVRDSHNKILPRANLEIHPFMYVYYDELNHMRPETNEACIIDVTSEATEIGIIREGVLTHVTHMPIGTYTIAREIATVCNLTKEEANSYLKGGVSFVESKLSTAKQTELEEVLTAYEKRLAELFKETGDVLAIPKSLFIHTDKNTEEFFTERIGAAAKLTTGTGHNSHLVTSELLGDETIGDTALALSAAHFHRLHKAA